MANKVKLINSVVAGKIPTTANIGIGEIALNNEDGKAYMAKTTSGTVTSISQISGATYVSSTAPANPIIGDHWLNQNSSIEYTYIGNNQWVQFIGIPNARPYISTGDVWTTATIINGTALGLYVIALAVNQNGLFVAAGTGGSPGSYFSAITSTDGITWTDPVVVYEQSWFNILFPGAMKVNSTGLFVVVGSLFEDGSGHNHPGYSTTTNGIDWSTPTKMPGDIEGYLNSLAVNASGLFVAVGVEAITYYPIYTTSVDGTTWSEVTRIVSSRNVSFSIAVNSAGLFVQLAGQKSSTSSDGSTWTTFENLYVGIDSNYVFITVDSDGLFVAGNSNGVDSFNFITSTDGIIWTTPVTVTIGSGSLGTLNSIGVDANGQFVAIGSATFGGNPRPVFTTSTDGVNWSDITVMGDLYSYPSSGVLINDIAVNSQGTFAAVGYNGDSLPMAAHSIG